MHSHFITQSFRAAENFAKKAIAAFNQAKPAFDEIRTKAADAFTFLRDTGITAFENIKAKIEENKPAIDKVIAVTLDLKDKLFQAWEKAKPAISYIATVAIPAVIGAMMKVIGAAATVYQKLDEWGLLIPIITGIAGAVAAVKMVKFAKDTMNTVKAVQGPCGSVWRGKESYDREPCVESEGQAGNSRHLRIMRKGRSC